MYASNQMRCIIRHEHRSHPTVMTILLSALTRYHVFDLALQLQKHGLVDGLVTAYPAFKLGRYADLEPAVVSLRRFAVARKLALAVDRRVSPHAASKLNEIVYSRWAGAYARIAGRSDASVIYGLSGYMKELLGSRARVGRQTVVDHGSLHIGTERRILSEECARHGFAPFGNWQYDWLVNRMRDEFLQADHVVCCSALARETMIEHGVAPDKVVVHRLGVNLGEFSRQADRGRDPSRPLRLLFVGAMTPLKGLHYLLDAFVKLPPDTELWLVGVQPGDPVLARMVDECARTTGRVRVVGPVPQSRLNVIYNQCDLFVLPSLSDGWGMVVSQALACGLPVVVSDMTGARELVTEGENGYVVKSRDADDLLDSLVSALDSLRHGAWRDGLVGTEARLGERSWTDYGNGWAQWLRDIDVC
jgi:glycosyltransferase involved in cell wall biosynthesis